MDNIIRGGKEQREQIIKGIEAHNAPHIKTGEPIVFCVEQDGRVAAGISGRLENAHLYIELLWVDESVRGQGLGKKLLKRMEAEAAALGATVITLFTFSFQAPDFYPKMGYDCFAVLDLGTHKHYYYKKNVAVDNVV